MEKLFGSISFIMFLLLLLNICSRCKSICVTKELVIKELVISMDKECDFSPLYLTSTANLCVAVEVQPLILNFEMLKEIVQGL